MTLAELTSDVNETNSPLQCAVCETPIPVNNGFTDRCARVERGDFRFPDDDSEPDRREDNIKFDRYICSKCFLEDPDLCAFFNKIAGAIKQKREA